MTRSKVVFLFDVDNTLLDNDRVTADLMRHLEREVGRERAAALLGDLRGAAQGARLRRLPGRAAALPRRASARPAPADRVALPGQLSLRQPPVSELARRHRAPAALGAGGDPLRRRRRLPAAQDRALRPVRGGRAATCSSTSTRSRSSTTSSAAIRPSTTCWSTTSCASSTAVKTVWGDARHHRLPAPGSLRARSRRSWRVPAGRRHRSSASASCSSYDLPALLRLERPVTWVNDWPMIRFRSLIPSRGETMKATQRLHDLGQSIWLDNITRDLLDSGTLKRYIDELSVTGLTSNPTIFDQAIKNSAAYDAAIREKLGKGKSGEALFFELALEDLTRAADLFRPIHERTNGVDGWVSLEVSPLLAYDTAEHAGRGQGASRPRRAAEPLHQDPRHEGGPARHRGGDLRRRADQRDAALLPRALPGRRRGVPARHRAAHRRRARTPRSARSPRSSSAAGTPRSRARCPRRSATSSASPSRSAPTRRTAPCSSSPRWQRVYNAGAPPAAPPVGQHGNQGPEGLRRPVRQGPRRAVHREHHARGHA